MLRKIALILTGLILTSFGFGQTGSIWTDKDVVIPASSIPHAGRPNTHYVIYKGSNVAHAHPVTATPGHPTPADPQGWWPIDIHTAYNIPFNLGTNAIAVVIWFHNPNALTDFQTFSSQFGLPTETSTDPTASTNQHFQQVYAQGSQPQSDADTSVESSLDIEWTHAMAPNAKIYLVEATDSSDGNLYGAVTVARGLPKVKEVSMSWGVPGEEPNAVALDAQYFNNTGCVYFCSAGDIGGLQSYPATSAYVVGVGGTVLTLDGNRNIVSETAWSDSGGGPSNYVPRPSFQNSIQSITGAARGCPDISAVAVGVAIYSGFGAGGWTVVDGTSISCPMSAGIANARGQFSVGPVAELNRIYNQIFASSSLWHLLYHDITSGSAGSFNALTGWDFITGIGAPHGLYPLANGSGIAPSNAQKIEGIELPVGNPFNLETVFDLGPYGETAASSVDFVLPQPAANYVQMTLAASLTSPLRATSQVFIWNPSTSKYEVVVSAPGTGSASNLTKDITNLLTSHAFAYNGNTIIRLAYRGIGPARSFSGPFVFKIGTSSLTGYLNQ